MYTLYHCVELAAITYLLCLCLGNTKSEQEKISFRNNESSLDLLKSKFIVGRWAV